MVIFRLEKDLARFPLTKHVFGYVGSKKSSVKMEKLVYAPSPDPQRSRKGNVTF